VFKILRVFSLAAGICLAGCVYVDRRPVVENSHSTPEPQEKLNTVQRNVEKVLFVVDDPTGTPLNVRGVRDNILCTVENGQVVEEIERDGAYNYMGPEWTLVKVNSGCSGKVWSAYLKKL